MQSSLIGKIQKAQLYAEETDRLDIQELSAKFRGDHDTYTVAYRDGHWSCTCSFFSQWSVCSHVMATQRMLGPVAPSELGEEPARSSALA